MVQSHSGYHHSKCVSIWLIETGDCFLVTWWQSSTDCASVCSFRPDSIWPHMTQSELVTGLEKLNTARRMNHGSDAVPNRSSRPLKSKICCCVIYAFGTDFLCCNFVCSLPDVDRLASNNQIKWSWATKTCSETHNAWTEPSYWPHKPTHISSKCHIDRPNLIKTKTRRYLFEIKSIRDTCPCNVVGNDGARAEAWCTNWSKQKSCTQVEINIISFFLSFGALSVRASYVYE